MHVLVLLKRCKEAGSQGKNCRKMVVGKTNEPLEILYQTKLLWLLYRQSFWNQREASNCQNTSDIWQSKRAAKYTESSWRDTRTCSDHSNQKLEASRGGCSAKIVNIR